MKSYLTLPICLFFICAGFSQDTLIQEKQTIPAGVNRQLKPLKGDWGVMFDLSGLVNNITLQPVRGFSGENIFLLRHHIQDDISLRIGLGLNSRNVRYSSVDSVIAGGSGLMAQQKWDSTYKNTDFFFYPGIEKHLFSSARVDPYIGAFLQIGFFGKQKINTMLSQEDTLRIFKLEEDTKIAGGGAIGLNLLTGLNFFFSEKIAVGAEYSWGFNYTTRGGDWVTYTNTETIQKQSTGSAGTPTVDRQLGSNRQVVSGFLFNSTGSITLSYFFSRNPDRN